MPSLDRGLPARDEAANFTRSREVGDRACGKTDNVLDRTDLIYIAMVVMLAAVTVTLYATLLITA